MDVIYTDLCPLCGKDLSSKEIQENLCDNTSRRISEAYSDDTLKEFLLFFEKCIGKPRDIQKMWARRILRGESFATTSPTGVGKTSFGIAVALFLATKGKKSYLIFPTSLLVLQCIENLKRYADRVGLELSFNKTGKISIGYYHGDLKQEEKEEFFSNCRDFSIIATTTQFLSRYFENIKSIVFDFIFVDDVDAVLKSSRNVYKILQLLGLRYENGWKGKPRGVLVVSTATAKKGKATELFRRLLNFDIGSSNFNVRNIEDFVVENDFGMLEKIIYNLGSGGVVYAKSNEEARKLYEILSKKFKVGIAVAGNSKDVKRFAEGYLDVLVGTSYYYGILVRGIDLPERIKYSIFVGCPVFKLRVEDIDSANSRILKTLALLYKEKPEMETFVRNLEKIDRDEELQRSLREVLKKLIETPEGSFRDVIVRRGEIIFPDIRTYIQGSGRTSRLFSGGVTKGASFLLESDSEILKAFVERAKYYEINFKTLDQLDFAKLKQELEESRKSSIREKDLIKPALFIVESPTKAKQISKFFGKPSVKVVDGIVFYEIPMEKYLLIITACLGHITDLVTDRGFHGVEVNGKFVPVYASIKRCRNCANQFSEESKRCPKCGSEDIDDSKIRIQALRKFASDVGLVIIGTDPDTEGEKISWDLKNLLSGFAEIKRAEFHEVTRTAILEAINNLREIDENLVKAQLVRRIEDRWIGFVLSQKLWKVFGKTYLSAGRAQTPVLGWIIQRYNESKNKKTVAFVEELDLALEHDKREFEIEIKLFKEKEEEKEPLPPYTTDSLLKDANAILKMSAKETMEIAQELFEFGLCTYHRTDSTTVSSVGFRIAKEYLGGDFHAREWKKEGAHECIRPTRAIDRDTLQRLVQEGVIAIENLTWRHLALYDIIFRRFMASQCKPFIVRKKVYEIVYDGKSIIEERIVAASGRAYDLYKSVWVRKELPIGVFKVHAKIKKVSKSPLLTQAEVVQLMRERGIGRPSTYATILDRLFQRGYILEKNGRLIPTNLGIEVYNYLSKKFANFVSEQRTALLEEKMDLVERGELDYYSSLRELYEEIKQIEGVE
ncbi:MAG: reverse gyrase [Archaeoglobaceae archaeon]